jgi:hypothetical protein
VGKPANGTSTCGGTGMIAARVNTFDAGMII